MNNRTRTLVRSAAIGVSATLAGTLMLTGPAYAAVGVDTTALRDAVTVDGVIDHLEAFQAIADANGGNRAAGTPGHEASLDYVRGLLDAAGYDTWTQEFTYERSSYEGTTLAKTSPGTADYEFGVDFYPAEFAAEGPATAQVSAVDINLAGDRASTSGCESADFAGFPAGDIALVQRGSCDFSVKVDNAVAAGAVGVLIFNQGNVDPADDRFGVLNPTLGTQKSVPVMGLTFDLGAELAATQGLVIAMNLMLETEEITTENLLADTPTGRTDRTVVVGGHLDSVPEGPGINDNGSGTAAILETALQMAELGIDPTNRVRFAFWSGEEDGLIGSSYYVSQLTKAEIKGTALNLNFDMIGSPNAVNFVYDGDGDAFGLSGPNGSAVIEDVFNDFFASQNEPTLPTDFDGRSDYFGFIEAGIPAGGLFTGAEVLKTAEQAAIFGGTPGVAYDPCYHSECDTIENIDRATLDVMWDAVAHATLVFAETTSAVNGTAKGKAAGKIDWQFKGHRALK